MLIMCFIFKMLIMLINVNNVFKSLRFIWTEEARKLRARVLAAQPNDLNFLEVPNSCMLSSIPHVYDTMHKHIQAIVI